jgi:hypothetical protein
VAEGRRPGYATKRRPPEGGTIDVPLLPLLFEIRTMNLLLTLLLLFADKSVSLFNGKSFDGWEGATKRTFRIEDGAIVGGNMNEDVRRNEFLCTTKEYGDFELRLKFKVLGKGTNAGVQIRSRRMPDHHEMIGYQADLGQGWYGSLYDESRRNKMLAEADPKVVTEAVKADDWNEYKIRCEGKRIRLWINGRQTVDYTEPDDAIEQRGLIGLQIHGGPPGEAWYKDVFIEEF